MIDFFALHPHDLGIVVKAELSLLLHLKILCEKDVLPRRLSHPQAIKVTQRSCCTVTVYRITLKCYIEQASLHFLSGYNIFRSVFPFALLVGGALFEVQS